MLTYKARYFHNPVWKFYYNNAIWGIQMCKFTTLTFIHIELYTCLLGLESVGEKELEENGIFILLFWLYYRI